MCVFQGYARSRVLRAALKQAQAAVDAAKEFQALVDDFENLAKYADPINVIKWKAVCDRIGASPYFPRQTLH